MHWWEKNQLQILKKAWIIISAKLHRSEEQQQVRFSPQGSSDRSLRIFSWNINGIAPFLQKPITSFFKSAPAAKGDDSLPKNQAEGPASLRRFLKRHRWPQVVCLQEVKINANDVRTKAAVKKAVNVDTSSGRESLDRCEDNDGVDCEIAGQEREPQYEVHFCLPRDSHNARGFGGKVYGVATLLRSDFAHAEVSRVREVDWDLEGRVLVVETRSKTAIFNLYAVNGTEYPYRDPSTGVVVGTRHDRKLAFHQLLLDECLALEKEGWRLILAGDFNVAREAIDGFPYLRTKLHQHVLNREDFNRKFFDDQGGLQAVDSWRHLHNKSRGYTYHPRGKEFGSGCDRIDLIMVSRSFIADDEKGIKLVDAGIEESVEERGPSDHVPLWVQLSSTGVEEIRKCAIQFPERSDIVL